jgi:hypothetical protein
MLTDADDHHDAAGSCRRMIMLRCVCVLLLQAHAMHQHTTTLLWNYRNPFLFPFIFIIRGHIFYALSI